MYELAAHFLERGPDFVFLALNIGIFVTYGTDYSSSELPPMV